MQKYSIFHASDERFLKEWHRPYAELFRGAGPVLDIGCGLGIFADVLREIGVDSLGIDFDPEMVKASTQRGHRAILGDQNTVATLSQHFQGIHISHVVEHLWGEDVVLLLERCWPLLNDAGRLIIRTPNWEHREVRHRVFWMDHTHRRPYPSELLVRILTDIGFSTLCAGVEPYGLNDLFVVAAKHPHPPHFELRPAFDKGPRGSRSLLSRLVGRTKHLLKPGRS